MGKVLLVLFFLATSYLILPKPAFSASDTTVYLMDSSAQLTGIARVLTKAIIGEYGPTKQVTQKGVVHFFAGTIDTMIAYRPASLGDFNSYMTEKFRVPGIPKAYAVSPGGFGYQTLGPILPIWSVARNVAYFLFSIVFIVVGVAIMLRIKIDPKTAVSIQNALPKIVWALILITFSYAIAGFLIDIMYVAINLIFTIFLSLQLPNISLTPVLLDLQQKLQRETIFGAAFSPAFENIVPGVSIAIDSFASTILAWLPGPIAGLLGGTAEAIAELIIVIAILWALGKTWFSLISSYANIILNIIFAPLKLMLGAIPNQSPFSNWIRDLLSNLLAFPLVILMLLLGAVLTSSYANVSDANFVPPLIGGFTPQSTSAIVGLAILLSIPRVVDILHETFKAPPFKYGNAWQESTQAVTGFGQKSLSDALAPESKTIPGRLIGGAGKRLTKFFFK